jgi:pyridoxine/pyridoxamine 5'-phosphate oxidase
LDTLLLHTLNECLNKLLFAGNDVSHPFRTGIVATADTPGINMRTVILREADVENNVIYFYTDIRSEKITDLRMDDNISWLFYDAEEKVQLRLSGSAIIHHQDEVTKRYWQKVSPAGRRSYSAMPGPSTVVDMPADGLTHLSSADNSADVGLDNFAVIRTQITFLEWLSLDRDGHRRAAFNLINGNWQGNWLIP